MTGCLLPWLGVAADPAPAGAVPDNLQVPAGRTLGLTLTARGVQIYECRPAPNGAGRFEWAFKAPEANLFDADDRQVGRHYVGPTWELAEGGKVVGRVKAKAEAPDGRGIPWLLLEATETNGPGIMGQVRSIQRLNTVGGQAPTTGADASTQGQEIRVAYTATYRFYVGQP